jgi:hypothetical protein
MTTLRTGPAGPPAWQRIVRSDKSGTETRVARPTSAAEK